MNRGKAKRLAEILPGTGGYVWWWICMSASWFWAIGFGGQAAWFVAAATTTLVTYATVVRLGWLQKPKLVRSCGKDRIRAGEPLRVKLMIDRGKASFPFTWMHVRDELYDASGKLAHVHHKLLYCGRSRHLVYEYEIPNTGRGEYRFGWTRIRLAEPLGIAGRKWITTGGPDRVVVYPRPLAGLADMMPWRHSDSGAAIGAAIASASPLVSTVRDYTHGDPLQRIHWKSTARTGGLKTKELDALQERRVTVVLDDAAEGYGRQGPPASPDVAAGRFETAVGAACAVVMDARRQGLAAKLIFSSGEETASDMGRSAYVYASSSAWMGIGAGSVAAKTAAARTADDRVSAARTADDRTPSGRSFASVASSTGTMATGSLKTGTSTAGAPDMAERRALEQLARVMPQTTSSFKTSFLKQKNSGRGESGGKKFGSNKGKQNGNRPGVDYFHSLSDFANRLHADEPLVVISPRLNERMDHHIRALRRRRVNVTFLLVGEGMEPNEQEAKQLGYLEVLGCRTVYIRVPGGGVAHG